MMGYSRFDTEEHLVTMTTLYRKKLRIMMNLFQPCTKLVSKKRVGSKVRKYYDKPQTPLDRLVSFHKSQKNEMPLSIQRLLELRDNTDPFILSKEVNELIDIVRTISYSKNLNPKARAVL